MRGVCEGDDDGKTGSLPLVRVRRRHCRVPITGRTDCEACQTFQLGFEGPRFYFILFCYFDDDDDDDDDDDLN